MWQQSEKYKRKYRIPPARAQWWNYATNGVYFITICTKNRLHFFGEIDNGEMCLSNTGVIANVFWYEIPKHFDFIELGKFVVMPNHIHGILIINKTETTEISETANNNKTAGQKRFQNQGKKTVSSIVGSYKSIVSRHAHRLGHEFAWQTRFHDHIVRNLNSYQNITNYIYTNPQKWDHDPHFKNEYNNNEKMIQIQN